ncbi:caffeine resistance protein [Xylariomycetidae sp. FL2044]|nr:caffeine resistance protein [Xylariomycetidae sp. FL2044]
MSLARTPHDLAVEVANPDATPPIAIEMSRRPSAAADKQDDPFLVQFDAPYDPENPKDWPSGRKWAVTDVLSATGFNRIMVSTMMAPALPLIARELAMTSTESVMALSIYLLATAFGPLVIGPLSEVWGREKVLHASNAWFLVWNIVCGFAPTKGVLIAARFLAGFGASAVYALAGGVLGDVWRPEQRGKSLGIYLLIPLLGSAVGPIIGGFMAERTTWRWMFWSTSAFQAVMIIVSWLSFHESYAPVILRRRAARLRRETGDQRYRTAAERLEGEKTPLSILGRALSRPVRLLAFHPIIQVTALLSGFYYGILYIVLSSFAEVWTGRYGQPVEIAGLHYLACALGEIVGNQIGSPIMDWYFRRRQSRAPGGVHEPEMRTPLMFPGAVLAPLALFAYGWAAQYRLPWAVTDVFVFFVDVGMQILGLPLQAYVIDAYPEHTSSAMAATQFVKSLTAFLFPLFSPAMYAGLGYGWGNTTLGLAGLVLGIPASLVFYVYGARLRRKTVSSY